MDHVAILIIVAAFLVYGLISRRLQSTVLTGPMLFAGFGLLAGPAALDLIPIAITSSTIHTLAEITLILVLFSDAASIDLRQLRRDHNLPLRMLLIGMPLTIIFASVAALLCFTEFSIWEALLLGAILAPTDAALGQAVISNPGVPIRIRQALNVESGLNDGIALPAVLMLAAFAGMQGAAEPPAMYLTGAALQLVVAPLVGIAVGYAGGRLVDLCYRTQWMSETAEGIIALALAFFAYELAIVLHGNGFIAAFVAGLAFGNTLGKKCKFLFEFAESEGQLLILSTFMAFGGVMIPIALAKADVSYVIYAVLCLSVVRMGPVAISLLGKGVKPITAGYLGWFGPRGLASIVFIVIVAHEKLPGNSILVGAVLVTVLFSVIGHGLTANPLARRFGASSG
jgi:NhaP-type Na+/H+ or K+/H+ antiporter